MLVFIQVGLGPWPLEEIHNPFNTTNASYEAFNEKDKRATTQIVTTKL